MRGHRILGATTRYLERAAGREQDHGRHNRRGIRSLCLICSSYVALGRL